jgi:glycosyltransferase involved in cell wall biosynthesis
VRVLHVINCLAGGGAENLLMQLLPKLKVRGIIVELLLLAGSENEQSRLLADVGIKINYTRRKWLYSPLQVISIIKHLKAFDIVHAHLFPSFLWVAIARRLVRWPKAVYTEHSTHNRRRKNRLFKFFDSMAYSQYEKIVCISGGVRESLIGYLRANQSKTEVIYNGIDLPRFCGEGRGRLLIGDEGILSAVKGQLLLCVANFLNGKGQEVLLRAMQLLPDSVHAAFVGKGPLKKTLRQLACRLNVQARVHFPGYIRDIQRVYADGRICIIPSLWEGFSIVAVEAMASGVPVVASRIPGLSEIVGDAGILFKPGDSMDLAKCISTLLKSTRIWEEQRRKGLKRAKDFSIDRTADQYCQLYSTIFRNDHF